ncbi:hypothetical protein O181_020810 [Austropuccinia psidii MF-1]|uniref:Uncharacterized protein n=1 Tax=Austropuccinia psidii MF-1 TaxID=1389203 RepID=A0A9Q3CEH3_9BASI|nr:hypothetical protein [Austropuccinia psidii MF-1]
MNLLIKSSISSSGGHPTPAFHIPQDLSTIFEHLQLEPVIENYICCAQCFFLNDITESVTTHQLHSQHHNDPNYNDPPCTQSLGKLINSFEPLSQGLLWKQEWPGTQESRTHLESSKRMYFLRKNKSKDKYAKDKKRGEASSQDNKKAKAKQPTK